MPTFPETTKGLVRRWNRRGPVSPRLTAPMERMLGLVRGRAWVFERVAKGRVLEGGAGTGKNLPYYPEQALVVASDLSPGMLARAVQKAGDRSRAVRFVVTDAEDLAFRDGSFDTGPATCGFCPGAGP